jgi:hypothetical protein
MPTNLRRYAMQAQSVLSGSSLAISATMRRHQLSLADRQCAISAVSMYLQSAIVMLVTSLYASQSDDELTRAAAEAMCGELERKISGRLPREHDYRQVATVGQRIASQGWNELRDVAAGNILMAYKDE